jgi:dTDP-4-dehydrorhamnose reductase
VQKLLITGTSGLLGNKIVKAAKHNYEVLPTYNTEPLHTHSVKLEITNLTEALKVFNKLEPNIVIHTASETNVDKCEIEKEHAWKTNAEGTRNIAEACQKVNAKLVCVSTDYVFDGEKGLYDEEDKPNPVNYYGLTKLEGEKQVIKHCKNYAILRTSVLYGWHPWKQNFTTWIIDQLKQGKEITVVNDHYNTPTWAGNLAEIAIEVAERNLQGMYHASGCERISRYEFAKQIARTFNLNADLVKPVKMSQLTAWVAKRPKDSSLNTGKIQKQLKTKPLNITEGLNKMKEEMET